MAEAKISRRQYLMRRLLIAGVPTRDVRTAVEAMAVDNPDWNLDEVASWDQWKRVHGHA